MLELPEGEEVVTVGTLYKDAAAKPSALDEYVKDDGKGGRGSGEAEVDAATIVAGVPRLAAPSDTLVLEDAGARVPLASLDAAPLVTGIVVAVRGIVGEDGAFAVSGVLFRGPATAPPRPPPARAPPPAGDPYLALTSRLAPAPDDARGGAAAALAVDLLTGHAGCGPDVALFARVVRVVVAGGLVPRGGGLAAAAGGRAAATAATRAAAAPLRDADALMTALAACVPVDVVPGPDDATNHGLPQQPLHRCLLPGAAPSSALTRATNPHEFDVGGVRVLGTAGQNVDDVLRYSNAPSRTAALSSLLDWGHLAPTAPDTLPCHPFTDADPFVLEAAPHVFFAGGAATLEVGSHAVCAADGTRAEVRTLAVPDFQATRTLVLLNLRTLEVHPVVVDV